MLALPTCSLHPHCPFFTLTHSSLACSSPSRGAIVVLFTRRKFSLTRGRFSLLIRAPFWLCAHPRAYAELFSLTQGSSPIFLTQLGKELPFSGHSRFPQSGIGYVFSCVLWVGVSSLVHGLCFGAVDLPTFLSAMMTNCIWATRFTE